jgi:hypothetical protein
MQKNLQNYEGGYAAPETPETPETLENLGNLEPPRGGVPQPDEHELRRTLKTLNIFAVVFAIIGALGFLALAIIAWQNGENPFAGVFVMPVVGLIVGILIGLGIPGFGLCIRWLQAMDLGGLAFVFLLIVTFFYVSPILGVAKYIKTKLALRRFA